MRRAARHPRHGLPLSLSLCFGVLTGVLSLSRWLGCHNHTFDLALYARMAWGLARGDVWNPIADAGFVHSHAAWVLLPLGVIGRVFGTPQTLLVTQALAIAACAWPLTRIAVRHLGGVGAWLVALLWVAYPNLGHVAAYEMHPGTLALVPLCWALDAFDRHDARALALATIAVLCCRADYALITAWMGVLLPKTTERRFRLATIVGSLAYFAAISALQRVLPAHGVSSADLHFGAWGGSPFGVLRALVFEPATVIAHVTQLERASYLLRVLLPVALLPLLSPRVLLIAAPTFALNLISVWPTATRLDSHYLTPAVPVLIVATLHAVASLRARWGHAVWLLLIAPMTASVLYGGLPWSRDFPRSDFISDAQTRACHALLSAIDPRASVQAPDPLLPHLAERSVVHRAPPPERNTDLVVLDASHRRRFARQETLLRTQEEPLLRAWLARDDHGLVQVEGDLLLLQRGLDPRALIARYIDTAPSTHEPRHLTECLALTAAQLQTETLVLHLIARGSCAPDLAIRWGADPRPERVELLFDGLLSPAHLRQGDRLTSTHLVDGTEAAKLRRTGLWIGALRASGARPAPSDPYVMTIAVEN